MRIDLGLEQSLDKLPVNMSSRSQEHPDSDSELWDPDAAEIEHLSELQADSAAAGKVPNKLVWGCIWQLHGSVVIPATLSPLAGEAVCSVQQA